ncbi:putative AMP-activated kinase, glycogen-binding protein [Helianthus annuus]|nr:putative AMP-activated kinase, glycogen-binding protein [Helianthus annuus]
MISAMALSHVILPSYKLFFFAAPEPRFSQLRHPHGARFLAGVCASSSSPSKTSVGRRRQTKTNADLCNDLREFISEIGLPDGHVPSLKELSQHGRQDLANIVRRRGYKLIKELLAASQEIKVSDSDAEGSLTEDKANKEADELTGPDENIKELTEYMSSSHEDMLSPHENMLGEGSTKLSLQEKVAKFIQSGELEEIEGSEEPSSKVLCESDSTSLDLENGSVLTSQLVDSTSQLRNITSSDQVASDEAANTDKDLEVEVEVKMLTKEDEAEINRIKVMLHNKELELSQLKEEIEKNKQALSELQAKAETEISKAQKLLLDKDAELLAAEESLSGLKQVQVEYWGEGETVQVAGSFNGWHHGVTLDPQPTSNITDPVELRNTRLWRSMLWLYPGIYEIKYIVDGKWMIDPMKEVVTRGSIQNNVLRVDR